MKLLIKMMVVFSTLYAVAGLMRSGRVQWPFAFLGTALVSFLGTAGDRILMPKMSRGMSVVTDMLLIAMSLCGARKITRAEGDLRSWWPYIGVVSAVLGGFECLYHEWVFDRDDYQELAEGSALH